MLGRFNRHNEQGDPADGALMARAEASMAGCLIVSTTAIMTHCHGQPQPSGWRADGAPSALSARSNVLLGRSARGHIVPDRPRTEPVAGEHGWASCTIRSCQVIRVHALVVYKVSKNLNESNSVPRAPIMRRAFRSGTGSRCVYRFACVPRPLFVISHFVNFVISHFGKLAEQPRSSFCSFYRSLNFRSNYSALL